MIKLKNLFVNHGWLMIIILPILFLLYHSVVNLLENHQINRENKVLEKKIRLKEELIMIANEKVRLKELEITLLDKIIHTKDSVIIINQIYTNEKIKSVDRNTPSELQEFLSNYKPLRDP